MDEVAELIRDVGPTLVVTILLDGPQLATRWTARYAGVLADDPGIGGAHAHGQRDGRAQPADAGCRRRPSSRCGRTRPAGLREISLEHGPPACS